MSSLMYYICIIKSFILTLILVSRLYIRPYSLMLSATIKHVLTAPCTDVTRETNSHNYMNDVCDAPCQTGPILAPSVINEFVLVRQACS